MGSSISSIYDDYDDYEYICKLNNIKTVNLFNPGGFYEHEKKILESLGFKSKYSYFSHLNKVEERNKKINNILC